MRAWTVQLLAPAVIFVAMLFVGPFIYAIWLSFTDLNFVTPGHDGNWIGFANYVYAIFADPVFVGSLKRSAFFAVLCVLPQLTFGIAVAQLLYHRPWAQRLLSPLLALPALIPAVAVALYWKLLLQGEFGVLSYYLSRIGFTFASGLLGDAGTILLTLAFIDFWQWAPFTALIFLAARSSVPIAPIEAAYLDGASNRRVFLNVVLPALAPTVFFVAIIRFIDAFKEFDKVYVITGGGPGTASELTSIYVWRTSFVLWEIGYGAALCVLIYVGIYLVTALVSRRTKFGDLRP
jgi:multiple sugar transport system permease protein